MDLIHHIVSDEVIYALGWTVLHSFWQAGIIALSLGMLSIFLQHKSARFRYRSSVVALFAVFASAIFTFLYLVKEPFVELNENLILASGGAEGLESTLIEGFLVQFSSYFDTHLPLIVSIWFIGFLLFLIRLMGGLAYIEMLKRRHIHALPELWQEKLARLKGAIGLQRKVALVESALVNVPMVIGFIKPMILLPIGAVNHLSTSEVEAILAHEIAHIKRADYIINILQSIMEALFYYNPAVWWISANIRAEREHSCDDIAIALCGNSLTYAKALVNLQEINPRVPALAMPFGKNKNLLLNRVKRILNMPQNKSNIVEKLLGTGLLLVLLVMYSFKTNDTVEAPELTETFHMELISNVEGEVELSNVFYLNELSDTLPERRTRQKLITQEDGKTTEMVLENGELIELTINGEAIPEADFGKYEDLVAKLTEDMKDLPPPPAPPAAPEAPQAPKISKRIIKKRISTDGDNEKKIIIRINEDDSDEREIEVEVIDDEVRIEGDGVKKMIKIISEDGKNFEIIEMDGEGDEKIKVIEIEGEDMIWIGDEGEEYELKEHELEEAMQLAEELEENEFELQELEGEMDEIMREVEETLAEQIELLEHEEMSTEEREEVKRELEYAKKELKREMKRLHKDKEGLHKDMKREIRVHVDRQDKVKLHHFNPRSKRDFNSKLEAKLLRDGLISDKDNYRFELKRNKLKINGKKQSKSTLNEYLEFYKKHKGKSFDKKSKYSIQKSE